jgi:hypothetical protein
MTDDLVRRQGTEEAFTDRLPYVLELTTGVRRQLDAVIPRQGDLRVWWAGQWTTEREALTQLRHAQLKRLESNQAPRWHTQMNTPAGHWRGHPVSAGDTVSWIEWHFADGYFEGRQVLDVLYKVLRDLRDLLGEARRRWGE